MNFTFSGGSDAQQAKFQEIVDASRYTQFPAVPVEVGVEWTDDASLKLHNQYAYTQNSDTGSTMKLRSDICGSANELLSYDVVHHELGHVLIGYILTTVDGTMGKMLALLQGKDDKTPGPDDWPVHNGDWGASALEAMCEIFKDVFSAKRRWDNRTIWKLRRDHLQALCDVLAVAPTTTLHDDLLWTSSVFRVGPPLAEYTTSLPPFTHRISMTNAIGPATVSFDLTWPPPHDGSGIDGNGTSAEGPWAIYPEIGESGNFEVNFESGSLVADWLDADDNLIESVLLGNTWAVGETDLNRPDGAVTLALTLNLDIQFVFWFYPNFGYAGPPPPPYAQDGLHFPSWIVGVDHMERAAGDLACPGWPYQLTSLSVDNAPPAKVSSPAIHASVTDPVAIR